MDRCGGEVGWAEVGGGAVRSSSSSRRLHSFTLNVFMQRQQTSKDSHSNATMLTQPFKHSHPYTAIQAQPYKHSHPKTTAVHTQPTNNSHQNAAGQTQPSKRSHPNTAIQTQPSKCSHPSTQAVTTACNYDHTQLRLRQHRSKLKLACVVALGVGVLPWLTLNVTLNLSLNLSLKIQSPLNTRLLWRRTSSNILPCRKLWWRSQPLPTKCTATPCAFMGMCLLPCRRS